MDRNAYDIAFLGFGEAGQAFLKGLRGERAGLRAAAYDIKTDDPARAEAKRADYAALGVDALDAAERVAAAEIIFSTVTADQAGAAARAAAGAPLGGALFLDCNSCAPETKRGAARAVEAAGGRYVDMAVMAPVYPKMHKVPCLIAGPHAEAAAEALGALGMSVKISEGGVGAASTRKMLRSVMIKGIEALVVECVLAARKAGVERDVIAALDASDPEFNWPTRVRYTLERVTTHGVRRAAEMREVAKTVEDLGFAPRMSGATAEVQQMIGDLGLRSADYDENDYAALVDAILGALEQGRST